MSALHFQLILLVALFVACDPVSSPTKPGTTGTTTSHPPEVFSIEPSLWGTTTDAVAYEVRQLPDGTPGIFTSDGALLLHLLPELVLEVGPADKRRAKPSRKPFELVKLTANPKGGFTLFARVSDGNAHYDLRIENGPHDPRVHVGLSTKWLRDVRVDRQILVFRTGPFARAQGRGHDYEWVDADVEWSSMADSPKVVRFGEAALTAIGRTGAENVLLRRVEDRWELEFEGYHHANHPLGPGNDCGEELDGSATFAARTRREMRADFVLGAVEIPVALRYPDGRGAAVALVEHRENAQMRAFAVAEDVTPMLAAASATWLGDSVDKLSCEGGRFTKLAAQGISSMWSGEYIHAESADLLAPTETDSRRVFAFHHPNNPVSVLFGLGATMPAPESFSGPKLAALANSRGLLAARAPLDPLLSHDASATKTVRESLSAASTEGSIWVTEVGELAQRLVDVRGVDFEFLPNGVVRVRNPGERDLAGFGLLLPIGVSAKYATGVTHQGRGPVTWFDLPARGDQLLQLFREDKPISTMRAADVAVSYEPANTP